MGVGFVHRWRGMWTEYYIFSRPDPIPVPWSAVCIWGNMHSEEWESSVRVPASVLGYLRSCVWQ